MPSRNLKNISLFYLFFCRKVAEVLKKFNETEFLSEPEKSDAAASDQDQIEASDSGSEKSAEKSELGEEEARAEALETIRNFVPKRPIVPSPMFPDLSLENEKKMRGRVGGSRHWHVPFRHSVYESIRTQKLNRFIDFSTN